MPPARGSTLGHTCAKGVCPTSTMRLRPMPAAAPMTAPAAGNCRRNAPRPLTSALNAPAR